MKSYKIDFGKSCFGILYEDELKSLLLKKENESLCGRAIRRGKGIRRAEAAEKRNPPTTRTIQRC